MARIKGHYQEWLASQALKDEPYESVSDESEPWPDPSQIPFQSEEDTWDRAPQPNLLEEPVVSPAWATQAPKPSFALRYGAHRATFWEHGPHHDWAINPTWRKDTFFKP